MVRFAFCKEEELIREAGKRIARWLDYYKRYMNNNLYNITIDLFEVITTLGYGTFGRVKLVRLKNTK
jgi:hypothetical protein